MLKGGHYPFYDCKPLITQIFAEHFERSNLVYVNFKLNTQIYNGINHIKKSKLFVIVTPQLQF